MAKYSPKSHDGDYYVQRSDEGAIDYVGPLSLTEMRDQLQALRAGEIEWSDLHPVRDLAPFERWPMRVDQHTVDIQRVDGGYRVTVGQRPQTRQRDGEVESIPGFDATSRALYPSEEEARLAATHITRDLREHGEIRENDFDIEDRVGKVSRPDRLGRAPISSQEYRQDHVRVFQVRDRLPQRNGDFFRSFTDVDGNQRVAFDGNNAMSVTPPLPSAQEAKELAGKLNRLQKRGVDIPFRAYQFSQRRQSDRRLFVDRIDGKYHVLFNGPNKLGRSRGFANERNAVAVQKELAIKIRQRDNIDWARHGFRWGKNPDRLTLREVDGGYELQYAFKENVATSNVIIESRDAAYRTLDDLRRQLYQGQKLDTQGWTYQRSAQSLSARVVQTKDEQFRIVTGSGRFFHEAFGDAAAAQAKLEGIQAMIDQGFEPEGPQWPFRDQLPMVRLSKSAEQSVDALANVLRADKIEPGAVGEALQVAAKAVGKQMETALEPLTPPEEQRLLASLHDFAEIKDLRSQVTVLNEVLDDPRFQEPIFHAADRAEAEPLLRERAHLETAIADLPNERQLAGDIARQLQGKVFDPAGLASQLDERLQPHGLDLLEKYQTAQRDFLPQFTALAHAAQKAGRDVPAEVLGEATKWSGTVKNLAPQHLTGLVATAARAAQAAKRFMEPERAAGQSL